MADNTQEEQPTKHTSEEDPYIKTATHNYVSRRASIKGANRVELKGKCVLKPNVTLDGEKAWVKAGRYCTIHTNSMLQPPPMPPPYYENQEMQYVPLILKNHVVIQSNCHIEAAAIGSSVQIGHDCTLGKRCIIKDCCIIEPNSHIADDTVVPPFTRMAGKPAVMVEELPESVAVDLVDAAVDEYQSFVEDTKK
mmetsp:Transcript_23008/g.35529  ORF Transcript_23008/g.35529 Transcript_23008/m.35529 type:complete len:194 (-) Transcript_23008:114-695(-)|eukprot:CAMPEP_0195298508 /NCGR_PEP_ID=MMETSP0707-20130614/23643_1 /TAXON_ID=33640 /ORGANISM="Asterionellopsis glacialis, Strain CCMP134" /LENGTH=193 /DNA_ID=CAMNT_0040360651 /DNA_START=204 /DNA_END=785 /DNA_ORIENTATION=+